MAPELHGSMARNDSAGHSSRRTDSPILHMSEQTLPDNMAVRETLFEEGGGRSGVPSTPKALQHKFSRRVGEVLLSEGLIDEMQLRLALERQRESGGFLVENLVALGFARPEAVGKYLDQATGFPFVDLSQTAIDLDLARV